LHFMSNSKKSENPQTQLLALESAKVFLGSSLQFVFQLYILQQTMKTEHEISQFASIIASFLLICKTSFNLYTYKRPERDLEEHPNESDQNFCTKLRNTASKIFNGVSFCCGRNNDSIEDKNTEDGMIVKAKKWLKNFWSHFPLLGLNIFFNLCCLNLFVQLLGWYSVIFISAVFIANFTILFTQSNAKDSLFRTASLGYMNLFFLSRPLENPNNSTKRQVKFLHLVRFFINTIFLVVFICYNSIKVNYQLKSPYNDSNDVDIIYTSLYSPFNFYFNVHVQREINQYDDLKNIVRHQQQHQGYISLKFRTDNYETSEEAKHTLILLIFAILVLLSGVANVVTILYREKNNFKTMVLALWSKSNVANETLHENYSLTEIVATGVNQENNSLSNTVTETDSLISGKRAADNEVSKPTFKRLISIDGSCAVEMKDLEVLGKDSNLTEAQIENLKTQVAAAVSDGNLDREQFKHVVGLCHPGVDLQQLEEDIFDKFDENKTGQIDARKLLLVIFALSRGSLEEKLRMIFQLVDANGDGWMDVEEYREIAKDIFVLANETKLSQASSLQLQLVMNSWLEMDTNKDGKVDLKDFTKACMTHQYIAISYIEKFAAEYREKKRKITQVKQ